MMKVTDNHKKTIRLLRARTIEDEPVQRAIDAPHEATGEVEWEQALARVKLLPDWSKRLPAAIANNFA